MDAVLRIRRDKQKVSTQPGGAMEVGSRSQNSQTNNGCSYLPLTQPPKLSAPLSHPSGWVLETGTEHGFRGWSKVMSPRTKEPDI